MIWDLFKNIKGLFLECKDSKTAIVTFFSLWKWSTKQKGDQLGVWRILWENFIVPKRIINTSGMGNETHPL